MATLLMLQSGWLQTEQAHSYKWPWPRRRPRAGWSTHLVQNFESNSILACLSQRHFLAVPVLWACTLLFPHCPSSPAAFLAAARLCVEGFLIHIKQANVKYYDMMNMILYCSYLWAFTFLFRCGCYSSFIPFIKQKHLM